MKMVVCQGTVPTFTDSASKFHACAEWDDRRPHRPLQGSESATGRAQACPTAGGMYYEAHMAFGGRRRARPTGSLDLQRPLDPLVLQEHADVGGAGPEALDDDPRAAVLAQRGGGGGG